MKKSICTAALAMLLACPAAAPAQGNAPISDSFNFGLAVGLAHAFDYYVGAHIGIDFDFRIGPSSRLAIVPCFSGGHDIERDMGVFNWTATIGYRHFVDWANKYATVLLGPTAGYWINTDNGKWITFGGTLQTALLWRGGVDYGLFAGLTLVHNASQVEDVPSQFDARIQVGGKLNF